MCRVGDTDCHVCIMKLCALGLLLTGQVVARGDELAESTLRSHKETIQSIYTLSCFADVRVLVPSQSRQPATCRSQLLIKGSSIHLIVEQNDGQRTERSIDNNRWFYLDSHSQEGRLSYGSGGIAVARSGELSAGDPLTDLMLRLHQIGTTNHLQIDQWARLAKGNSAKRLPNGDVVISFIFADPKNKSDWRTECVFSQAHNWLIKSVHSTGSVSDGNRSETARYEREVDRFAEVKTGTYFPMETHSKTTFGDIVSSTRTVVVSKVLINTDITDDQMRLTFPKGVDLFDETTGTKFRIDTNGRRIDKKIPVSAEATRPTSDNSIKNDDIAPDSDTVPVWRRNRLWIWLSVVAIIGGLVTRALRNRFRKTD
jgi:hypothetical protein